MKNFFATFDVKTIGDYLCYKQRKETKISVGKFQQNSINPKKAQNSKIS
jgi:hypothetical protein